MKSTSKLVTSCARRRAVRALAVAGTMLTTRRAFAQRDASGMQAAACVLTPEQTEGPYFVDERRERTDIRSDPVDGSIRPGTPLALALRIAEVADKRCAPLRGAIVDVWHCDAAVYSDADDAAFHTRRAKFLRGYQVTDADGRVRFVTIYPGAYRGRAVHIHFKVRPALESRTQFTSQLYFDDALTDRVHADKPYSGALRNRMRNGQDFLFRAGGAALVLKVARDAEGCAALYDVGVRLG
jgi:protocatechuate 3,4-dioxygenase beta subunit